MNNNILGKKSLHQPQTSHLSRIITAGNGYPLIENPRVLMLQNPPFAELQSQLSLATRDLNKTEIRKDNDNDSLYDDEEDEEDEGAMLVYISADTDASFNKPGLYEAPSVAAKKLQEKKIQEQQRKDKMNEKIKIKEEKKKMKKQLEKDKLNLENDQNIEKQLKDKQQLDKVKQKSPESTELKTLEQIEDKITNLEIIKQRGQELKEVFPSPRKTTPFIKSDQVVSFAYTSQSAQLSSSIQQSSTSPQQAQKSPSQQSSTNSPGSPLISIQTTPTPK
ncbi:MAG: hypothetical protein EZS28_023907 [Streblomastix strix]|uniref:Uncharacterized protein n=1 Tax=Streblomastix strix TaxID=222440 RepID=A0A5J4VDF0_9EUKA|nr:MAG: hypothetical protein EZS28_023907 [Streblomastix strix]